VMFEVFFATANKVIDRPDFETLFNQQIDHVATDKPSATGNYRNGTGHVIWHPGSSLS
jgi:hypothetical protein